MGIGNIPHKGSSFQGMQGRLCLTVVLGSAAWMIYRITEKWMMCRLKGRGQVPFLGMSFRTSIMPDTIKWSWILDGSLLRSFQMVQ